MSIKGFSVGGNVERYDYNFLDNLPSEITIDTALSDSSTNPVQNRVVTSAINSANGSISSISGEVADLKSDVSLLSDHEIMTNCYIALGGTISASSSASDITVKMPLKQNVYYTIKCADNNRFRLALANQEYSGTNIPAKIIIDNASLHEAIFFSGDYTYAYLFLSTNGARCAFAIQESVQNIIDLSDEIYNKPVLSFTDNMFVDGLGNEYSSTNFALSNQIEVAPNTIIEITTELQGSAAICVFDKNDALVKSVTGTSGVKAYTVSIPSGSAYIKFSCYKSNKEKAKVRPLYVSDSLNEFINYNGSDIVRSPTSSEVIDGYLLTRDGYEASTTLWEITDYIPIYPKDSLDLYCYLYGNGAVVIYDEDKNIILGIDGNNASDYGGANTASRRQLISLSNMQSARYVRFSSQKSSFNVTQLSARYNVPWKDHAEEILGFNESETYKSKKILVVGDSISSDAYGNYKKWVTNLIDEDKFSRSNVTNSSQHATGFVARYNDQANDFISRVEAITDKSTYDLVIVFGGINDYIQNVPLGESGQDKTVYFKPAVDYFFNYLIENFTQARICVLLPLRTYNIYPNTAGNKQEVYSQYIHEVAKNYCLPVLNLTEESGFCPYINSFKQMWTLIPSGYTDPDGTHPTAEYEKKYLAPMIWDFISGLI